MSHIYVIKIRKLSTILICYLIFCVDCVIDMIICIKINKITNDILFFFLFNSPFLSHFVANKKKIEKKKLKNSINHTTHFYLIIIV